MPRIEPYRDGKLPERFNRWLETLRIQLRLVPAHVQGSGSPEGAVNGEQFDMYLDLAGSPGARLYVKTTNGGNTGWEIV